jgi:uncharacterized protein YbaP (TraB family)
MFTRFVRTLATGLALLLAGNLAHAIGPVKHGKGLLWEISGKGVAPSYLFGTIHSSDPRVTRLPPVLEEKFDKSRSYSMELIFSGAGFVTMGETMFFEGGQTLETVLGPDLYRRTREVVEALGQSTQALNNKKPWAVIMMLGTPREGNGLFLDLALQMRATLQKKPTFSLETMQEQLSVFDGMTLAEQVQLLEDTLKYYDESDEQMQQLMAAYLRRDLAGLAAISDRYQSRAGPAYRTLMNRLLVQRNQRMAERLQPRLQEGNAFVAVGALHLPGKDGLLALLEARGYKVRPLY